MGVKVGGALVTALPSGDRRDSTDFGSGGRGRGGGAQSWGKKGYNMGPFRGLCEVVHEALCVDLTFVLTVLFDLLLKSKEMLNQGCTYVCF